MKNLAKITLLCVGFMSFTALANTVTAPATIKSITNWSGGGNEELTVILNENSITNPAGCPRAAYVLPASHSDIARSMLLAAKVSNQQVTLVIWGGGCSGSNSNQPAIVNVGLPE